MPMMSVIIPVYNAVTYIPTCVASLQAQEYRDFEVIFVNDGSKDDSEAMLQRIAIPDVSITVLTQENQGQGMARNYGIQHSKGEFLCFVDIDDTIEPQMLRRLYEEQRKTDADIVWCNAWKIIHGQRVGSLDDGMLLAEDDIATYMLNNAGPWRKLIRSSIIHEHGLSYPPIRFYEDIAITPAYAIYAKKITYVKEPLYNYVMHEGSTMHQTSYDKRLEDIFASMAYLRKQCSKINGDMYQDIIEYIHIDHVLHAASLRFFSFHEGKDALAKVCDMMHTEFPNWKHNRFVKQKDWKYRLVCTLFYKKQYWLLKRLIG